MPYRNKEHRSSRHKRDNKNNVPELKPHDRVLAIYDMAGFVNQQLEEMGATSTDFTNLVNQSPESARRKELL